MLPESKGLRKRAFQSLDVLYKQCQSELSVSISKRKDGAVFHHYTGTKYLEVSKLPEDCGRPGTLMGFLGTSTKLCAI